MPEIVKQLLSVGHHHAPDIRKEGLLYRVYDFVPAEPNPVLGFYGFAPINSWFGLHEKIERLRTMVVNIIEKAKLNESRENSELDWQAAKLAKEILPQEGFAGMIKAKLHPQLDTIEGYASDVPWEFLQEFHWVCQKCHQTSMIVEPPAIPNCPGCRKPMLSTADETKGLKYFCPDCKEVLPPVEEFFCQFCGAAMQLINIRLATHYYMSHLSPPGIRISNNGKLFLIIEDPTGDLCSKEKDPEGICHSQIDRLYNMINAAGFTSCYLQGQNANRQAVLQYLENNNVVGIYYFGHGYYDNEKELSYLALADGLLSAGEIEGVKPAAKFVFLNACEGARGGGNWAVDKVSRSVAQAFASGGTSKVVIATICPVVNTHAARTANEFFDSVKEGNALGKSLMSARNLSLDRYQKGMPDISWMAYRFFGDPNKTFPKPEIPVVTISGKQKQKLPSRVFNKQGILDRDVFGFDIDGVLLRAVKRRNIQGRAHITITDIVAGLVRKGELLRHLLRQLNIDPDNLYKDFEKIIDDGQKKSETTHLQKAEKDTTKNKLKQQLREVLSEWIADKQADFTEQVCEIFKSVDIQTQQEGVNAANKQISEKKIIEVIINSGHWPNKTIVNLPGIKIIQNQILERERWWAEINENGAIVLNDIDKATRNILDKSHALARQRGSSEITYRIMLASLLAESNSYASRVFRAIGWDPKIIYMLMVALQKDTKLSDEAFVLSLEVCKRVVMPLLNKAREIAADEKQTIVTEAHLFKAFWIGAVPQFKKMLESFLCIDMDRLALIDPEHSNIAIESVKTSYPGFKSTLFEREVWQILAIAANTAFAQNCPEIKSPHLFAAMIDNGNNPTGKFLKQNNLEPYSMKSIVLSTIPWQLLPKKIINELALSENVRQILTCAVERAGSRNSRPVEEDLFTVFFAGGGSIVGEILRQAGINSPIMTPCHTNEFEETAKQQAKKIIQPVELKYGITVEVGKEIWPWLRKKLSEKSGGAGISQIVNANIINPLRGFLDKSQIWNGKTVKISIVEEAVSFKIV